MVDYKNRHAARLKRGIERLTRTEFMSVCVDDWDDANLFDSCRCDPATQCNFCVCGYSLHIGDYVNMCVAEYDALLSDRTEPSTTPEQDYDRAMRCIL